jgi:parallel beta-helix repeat protein
MNAKDIAYYTRLIASEYTQRRLPTASISGGIPVTNWTHVSGNTFSATLSLPVFVTQLFVDNQRIVRTRVPMNHSDYLYYAASLNNSVLARRGFQYVPGQFDYKSLDDAMVIVYHSWTESHHYIDKLITSNHTIFFTNPANYAIGRWVIQGQKRFHIENLCEALAPNSFCFVNKTKTIYLMTDGSYDPMKTRIIAPVNEYVVIIAGEDVNKPVEDIIVNNVAIQHGAWNISRTERADRQAAAFLPYAALYIANATSITISNIEISHTGSYGVWIREGTTNINFINSLVTDTGAGGIRVGQMISPVPTPTSSIKIISNEVSYGGNAFPCGVGIINHRATDVVIADNSVHHYRYTGISIGWEYSYNLSYTSNILVQGNYIYNIGLHILCEQAGIYTLGVQPGTIITGNVIKNVFGYSIFMWGIYLDNAASQFLISNNIVYNTGWASLFQHYGANNTIINNVFARASLIEPPHPGDPIPDGYTHIAFTENHTSWILTRNIFYDTFKGSNHSMFKSDAANISVSFSNNLYYNPYGTPLLFGIEQTSFAEWQKSGQDNGSVIADPLFAGDVNQCDFFTVQANSPAAALGFANITKLSKWTPGCSMDDRSDHQFYHW